MKEQLKQIEALLREQKYAEAEEALKVRLEKNPDDWEAKLLHGVCRKLQGDGKELRQTRAKVLAACRDAGAEEPVDKWTWRLLWLALSFGLVAVIVLCGTLLIAYLADKYSFHFLLYKWKNLVGNLNMLMWLILWFFLMLLEWLTVSKLISSKQKKVEQIMVATIWRKHYIIANISRALRILVWSVFVVWASVMVWSILRCFV